jgi:ferrous iron transport protein B
MGHDKNSTFMMELPTYRWPKLRVILQSTYLRVRSYLEKAGPTIVVIALGLWVFTHLPYHPGVPAGEQMAQSYAGRFGQMFLDPIMHPLGFDWRIGVALICGFAAREVLVGAIAIVLSVASAEGKDVATDNLLTAMHNATIAGTAKPLFTVASSVGLLIFVAFALQCLSTVSVAHKETGGWRVPLLQIFVFTGLAYVFAVIVNQGLTAIGLGA